MLGHQSCVAGFKFMYYDFGQMIGHSTRAAITIHQAEFDLGLEVNGKSSDVLISELDLGTAIMCQYTGAPPHRASSTWASAK